MPKSLAAADIMTTKLVTVTPDMNVMEAVTLLLKHRISGAPVVEPPGNLVGILSELDCVRHMCHRAMENLPPLDVSALMTREVVTVAPDAKLFTVVDIFASRKFRRVPVVDGDGHLVGQISRRDILKALHDLMRERQGLGQVPLYLSAIHDEAPAKVRG